jgi:hypothetical protein
MIFKSFLLSSLSFSMRIINSVIVVGLYYGFLTTFNGSGGYLLKDLEDILQLFAFRGDK